MDIKAFFTSELDQHRAVLAATEGALEEPFRRLVEACLAAVRGGNAIAFFGNGGSAADAQHLATELTVRYKRDRTPIAALALTTDSSSLTAIGNDYGFDDLFARQVEALVRPSDVVIAISTSGNSENVIRGLAAARAKGAVGAGLTGRGGGRMVGMADPLLIVPSDDTARIQEMHITLGHMLCGALEEEISAS
ncbi:MAG: SIS domain-containing protein [Rhodospirillales bacterium]|jgi:D-sedoheptulose 7-phosphate isomerase|nr:SIS domain-containing protein [Rhodospirillales bacterium]